MPAINGVPCNNFFHVSVATALTTIKNGPGLLHTVTVNTPVAAGTVTLQDGSTIIAVITTPATAGNPFELTFDIAFVTNLQITTTGAQDVTVNWQ